MKSTLHAHHTTVSRAARNRDGAAQASRDLHLAYDPPRAGKRLIAGLPLYLIALPGVVWFLVFRYLPMWGVLIAFKDYSPFHGFIDSPWVGYQNFVRMVRYPDFWRIVRNSIIFSFNGVVFHFPVVILLALMLNEVRTIWIKRSFQTFIYVPHFVSWVVISSLTMIFFSSAEGPFSRLLGSSDRAFLLAAHPQYFRLTIVLQGIWKSAGWGTIVLLAALSAIDPQTYEAADIDGASRWQKIRNVTLPGLMPTIMVLLLLQLGNFMNVGFEQIFLMLNPLMYEVGDVFETYAYRQGIQRGAWSYTTAIGLFKSVVGMTLILGFNSLAKRLGQEGLF